MSEGFWIQPQGCSPQPLCLLQTVHGRVREGFRKEKQQWFKAGENAWHKQTWLNLLSQLEIEVAS